MRRVLKTDSSEIISQKYTYPKDRKMIVDVLKKEHHGFCAYTDDNLIVSSAKDVEHFNPTLKPISGTQDNTYENWFCVSHKWNNKKGDRRRWNIYQPAITPVDEDLENRIVYDSNNHLYIAADPSDNEAKKFIEYLFLNDSELVVERSTYIQALFDNSPETGREHALKEYLKRGKSIPVVRFPRAIETIFNFNPITECLA